MGYPGNIRVKTISQGFLIESDVIQCDLQFMTHGEDMLPKCSRCDKRFPEKCVLKLYIQRHTGEKSCISFIELLK